LPYKSSRAHMPTRSVATSSLVGKLHPFICTNKAVIRKLSTILPSDFNGSRLSGKRWMKMQAFWCNKVCGRNPNKILKKSLYVHMSVITSTSLFIQYLTRTSSLIHSSCLQNYFCSYWRWLDKNHHQSNDWLDRLHDECLNTTSVFEFIHRYDK
jgi:hypothetical protein